ncbi:MAG: CPBP family glutamic-type intramembrane protease [Methylococcales bacterium]
MIRTLYFALLPLLILLFAIALACLISYFVVLGFGEFVELGKIISKSTQILLILSIFPISYYLKISKAELGFAPLPIFLKQLLVGFGLGFITLMPVFIVLYLLGVNIIDDAQIWTTSFVFKNLVISLLLALLISLIEEPLFRGLLLVSLHKKLSTISAVVISASYYAALHFINNNSHIAAQDINIYSGFTLLTEAFTKLLNPAIFSAFLALLMVGIFLGVLRTQLKSSLGFCIGCHTCWVWQIKMNKTLFNTDFKSDYHYLVSSYDGVIGPLVTVWLLLAVISYFIVQKMRSTK